MLSASLLPCHVALTVQSCHAVLIAFLLTQALFDIMDLFYSPSRAAGAEVSPFWAVIDTIGAESTAVGGLQCSCSHH